MFYDCDMCKTKVITDSTKKLLGRRYCVDCIPKVRAERRKQLNMSQKEMTIETSKKNRQEQIRQKGIEYEMRNSLENIIEEIAKSGPKPLVLPNLPIRLKRNEKVYFLAGKLSRVNFYIAITLTNQRLFFVTTEKLLQEHNGNKSILGIIPGIKTVSLSSVIAIDVPNCNDMENLTEWEIALHLDKGKDISFNFKECRGARLFYSLLAEMIDRLNDPIDYSIFSPKRERIPDDVKVAVWRRDGGVCVRCGSRVNLEYDHIVPVSKGGSNTLRNIELLCESCNRNKSNRVM